MNERICFLALLMTISFCGVAEAQAPLELGHGEQITVSCAPAPPACPSSCGDAQCDPGESMCSCPADCGSPPPNEPFCTDGLDNDCDGLVDCADPDCGPDPACAPPPPPPPGGGENLGLERKWRWDNAHAVTCDTMPVDTLCMGCVPPDGSCIHHLLDGVPNSPAREATEKSELWWPDVEPDGIRFVREEDDQLLFESCSSLNPLVCTEQVWQAGSGESWAVAFVGQFLSGGGVWLGNAGEVNNLSLFDHSTGGWLRTRMNSSARVIVSTDPVPYDTPLGLVVYYEAGALSAWRREPCQPWEDITTGSPVNVKPVIFGCWSCYYPNGWIAGDGSTNINPGVLFFREGRLHRAMPAALRPDLHAYLDAEHGAWIDEGCSP